MCFRKQSVGQQGYEQSTIPCFFRMNTRNDQSKGHSRQTGDEREREREREREGKGVCGVLSAAKWGYTTKEVFRTVAVLITFAVSAQLFAREDGLESSKSDSDSNFSSRAH
jgi:hypothetical protein